MASFVLQKMSGAGNTFVVVNAAKNLNWKKFEQSLKISLSAFAQKICAKTQANVDGLLILREGTDSSDYIWDFYNSDGSTAEMCGNAARCAAVFCHQVDHNNKYSFMTGAGLVTAKIENNKVHVTMPETKYLHKELTLMIENQAVQFVHINSGVPHLIFEIRNINEAEKKLALARQARSHEDIMPAGANVTFVSEVSSNKIDAITFERGVEGFTQACGTGAVAAAYNQHKKYGINVIQVKMPGGELEVIFNQMERPVLVGDAKFIGTYEVAENE